MSLEVFKIGTRNSPLALRQADILCVALKKVQPDLDIEIVPIKSKADWKKNEGEKPLSEESGGKGLFAKEIEEMILTGLIDCGVHSLKDMASFLPEGLIIEHVLPRDNPLDAFVSKYKTIAELPEGAVVGSCSARRSAMILSMRPDIKIVPFRGNVQTRLDKINSGQVDATFLAMAGIERLDIKDKNIHPLAAKEMLPACGQGVICMETRVDDTKSHELLNKVHCVETGFCVFAEREVLGALDGSCHTPIAAFAEMNENILNLHAEVYALDGREVFKKSFSGQCENVEQAMQIGQSVGHDLTNIVPVGMLA